MKQCSTKYIEIKAKLAVKFLYETVAAVCFSACLVNEFAPSYLPVFFFLPFCLDFEMPYVFFLSAYLSFSLHVFLCAKCKSFVVDF